MIVAAAVKINGAIITMSRPARHADILRQISGLYGPGERPGWTYEAEEQGFLTDDGVFLNRRAAYHHAHICGQGTPRRRVSSSDYAGDELYSEDLW
ncbi:hypothetical protein [Ottowia sp. VDI28]|uniref:hypothetical protein n=1 Tax=Ottowia sp. VDI28 TaxID=3133968 RepID=UPI003C2D25E4